MKGSLFCPTLLQRKSKDLVNCNRLPDKLRAKFRIPRDTSYGNRMYDVQKRKVLTRGLNFVQNFCFINNVTTRNELVS